MRSQILVKSLQTRQQGGFTLIHLIVIMAGILLCAGALLHLLNDRVASLRIIKASNRLTLLEEMIRNTASSQNALFISAAREKQGHPLNRCLVQNNCVSNREEPRSFTLYNSFEEKISGDYLLSGEPCTDAAAEDCVVEVSTHFGLACPDGANVCDFPEVVATHYEIAPRNGSASSVSFSPRSGSVALNTSICPLGQYVRAVDANGRFHCEAPRLARTGLRCQRGAAYGLSPRGEIVCSDVLDVCNKPLSLVTVIDASGSMDRDGKLDFAKEIAGRLTDRLKADDAAALVTFSATGQIAAPLANDRSAVKKAVAGLTAEEGTNLAAALLTAETAFKEGIQNPVPGILLLSDGGHNLDELPTSLATRLKEFGIRIWSIGLGKDPDGGLLQKLASTPDNYGQVGHQKEIAPMVDRIGKDLCR